MYFRYLIVLFLSLVLVGCGGKRVVTKEVTVTKVETKVVVPNTEMLRECPATPPFDTDLYITSNFDKKEDMMTNHIVNLYKDIKNCNIQVDKLKVWFDEQKKIYEKTN